MKIGFCGTMSVGKTTLVDSLRELDEFKDYKFATERSKYLNDLGIPLNTSSTLKGQIIFLAERAAELMNENIITDRTVVDVMAFTHLSKDMELLEKAFYSQVAVLLLEEYDYIFYISPIGLPIENNGVRETNSIYRDNIDQQIQNILELEEFRIKNLHTIEGTTEERIQQVLNVIGK